MKQIWKEVGLYTGAFLAGLAIVTGGPILRERLTGNTAGRLTAKRIADWQTIIPASRLIGDSSKAVHVIEFADFQCPGCREINRRLDSVAALNGKPVALAYVFFPLTYHQYGKSASIAAECAAEQGRFEPYHDILFAKQDSLGAISWVNFASRAGVSDLPTFQRCLAGSQSALRVSQGIQIGNRVGVQGTPSFIIDGRLYPFQTPTDQLVKAISTAAR